MRSTGGVLPFVFAAFSATPFFDALFAVLAGAFFSQDGFTYS